MVPAIIAVLVFIGLWIAIHRHQVQSRKHERQMLRRIADNYFEPHKSLF